MGNPRNEVDENGRPRSLPRRIWRENGLSIVVFTLFLIFWVCQIAAGWRAYNSEREDFHESPVGLRTYLTTGHFVESTAENWESEFLQMAMFAWLTCHLYQRGSAESHDPYHKEPDPPVTKDSPWPVRRGGWAKTIYGQSLGLALFAMFLVSFVLHLLGGRCEYNEQQARVGAEQVSIGGFLVTSDFWFQSFQNWQSEFLSIGMMVVLTIFLRQNNSAESKPLTMPNASNE
jgi:hypothetical protein